MKLDVIFLVIGQLAAVRGIQVPQELRLGGCDGNDTFRKAGDAFTGMFWVGPSKQNFCLVDGEFRFMISGRCSDQAISCDRRQADGVDLSKTRVTPKVRNIENFDIPDGPPTFVQSLKKKRRSLSGTDSVTQLRNMVLMIKFKDHNLTDLPPVEDYESLFNSMDGPDGHAVFTQSIKEFYSKQSSGRLNLTNILSGWIEVNYTETEASGGCPIDEGDCCNGVCDAAMLPDAIIEGIEKFETNIGAEEFGKFDEDSDFWGLVDMFTVIHSGFGAEALGGRGVLKKSVWSHKYILTWKRGFDIYRAPKSGLGFYAYNINPGRWFIGDEDNIFEDKNITHFGVIAHEMGHFLGLPDLYDTDYSSRGLGDYCLMANSWGVDGSQNYPPSLSAVSKNMLDWVDPIVLYVNETVDFSVTLPEIHSKPVVAMIYFSEVEFWLIENRQPEETDSKLHGGILIFHVTYTQGSNSNELEPDQPLTWSSVHPLARLIQPDNKFDLERLGTPTDAGDWFPYGSISELSDDILPLPNINSYQKLGERSGIALSNFSASAPSMTFQFTVSTFSPTASPSEIPTTSPSESPSASPSESPTSGSSTPTQFSPGDPVNTAARPSSTVMFWILIAVSIAFV